MGNKQKAREVITKAVNLSSALNSALSRKVSGLITVFKCTFEAETVMIDNDNHRRDKNSFCFGPKIGTENLEIVLMLVPTSKNLVP